jgi:hypothetical protein
MLARWAQREHPSRLDSLLHPLNVPYAGKLLHSDLEGCMIMISSLSSVTKVLSTMVTIILMLDITMRHVVISIYILILMVIHDSGGNMMMTSTSAFL